LPPASRSDTRTVFQRAYSARATGTHAGHVADAYFRTPGGLRRVEVLPLELLELMP